MQQPITPIQGESWIKILPKGLITIPKKMRLKLGIKDGDVAQVKISGNAIIIEPREAVEYRLFTDKEIKEWEKEDKLPTELASKAKAMWQDIP